MRCCSGVSFVQQPTAKHTKQNTKDYYDLVYADGSTMERFHRDVNGSDAGAVRVAEWSGQGEREVTFLMRLAVPATIRKVIGKSCRLCVRVPCVARAQQALR